VIPPIALGSNKEARTLKGGLGALLCVGWKLDGFQEAPGWEGVTFPFWRGIEALDLGVMLSDPEKNKMLTAPLTKKCLSTVRTRFYASKQVKFAER
jgi:hypothetical protein